MALHRDSDRWVTPRVVAWFLFLATILVLAVIGSVTYLTAAGRDPGPMLDLTAKIVTAVSAIGGFAVQLAGRRTQAKTERNTGTLTTAVVELDDAVRQLEARQAERDEATQAHPFIPGRPPVPPRGAAPAATAGGA